MRGTRRGDDAERHQDGPDAADGRWRRSGRRGPRGGEREVYFEGTGYTDTEILFRPALAVGEFVVEL